MVVSGDRWNGTSKTTPGVAHYVVGQTKVRDVMATVAMCGLVVVPHTYQTDEQRPGCAKCAAQTKQP